MCKPYQKQEKHATIENQSAVGSSLAVVFKDNGETDAEKKREDSVELPINKDIEGPLRYGVYDSRWKLLFREFLQKGIKGEFRIIRQTDAQKGKPPQGIQNNMPLPSLNRCPVYHSHSQLFLKFNK